MWRCTGKGSYRPAGQENFRLHSQGNPWLFKERRHWKQVFGTGYGKRQIKSWIFILAFFNLIKKVVGDFFYQQEYKLLLIYCVAVMRLVC